MAIDINKYIAASDAKLPLYREYGEQESRAYLVLDVEGEGEMWAAYKAPHENGCNSRQWSGIQRWYQIPNNLTELGYNQLMTDSEILTLCERIVAGAEYYWDGNNYRVRLSDDARDADEELSEVCSMIDYHDYCHLEAASAAHYLNDTRYHNLVLAGEDHDAASERLAAEALRDGYYVSAVEIEKALDQMSKDEE